MLSVKSPVGSGGFFATLWLKRGGDRPGAEVHERRGQHAEARDGEVAAERRRGAGLVALVILWVLVASFVPPLWGAPLLMLNPKMRQTVRDPQSLEPEALPAQRSESPAPAVSDKPGDAAPLPTTESGEGER